MNDIKLFTAQVLQGVTIEKYLDVVTANQVAGTGFFTDLTASFSDFFGGNSGAYRDSMNELYENVLSQIKNKARALRANAIIDIKVDYDSISAKNMSMFMVSMQGTAVIISEMNPEDTLNNATISLNNFNDEIQKRQIEAKLKQFITIGNEDWRFIIQNKLSELSSDLHCYFKKRLQAIPDIEHHELYNLYEMYLNSIPYEKAVEIVYSDPIPDRRLVNKCNLFNAKAILNVAITQGANNAVPLLKFQKSYYNSQDLEDMKELLAYYINLPEIWKEIEEKGGFLSKGGIKHVCVCGHKNDPSKTTCESCGRDRKGLTQNEISIIEGLKFKVEVLEEVLNKK